MPRHETARPGQGRAAISDPSTAPMVAPGSDVVAPSTLAVLDDLDAMLDALTFPVTTIVDSHGYGVVPRSHPVTVTPIRESLPLYCFGSENDHGLIPAGAPVVITGSGYYAGCLPCMGVPESARMVPCRCCGRPIHLAGCDVVPVCSLRCYRADARARRRAEQARPCDCCGVTFIPRRSDARYCGATCRQRAHRTAVNR